MSKKSVSLSLGKAAALVPAVVAPGVASDSYETTDFGDFGDLAGAVAVAGASDDFGELVMVPDIVVSTTASTNSEVSAVYGEFEDLESCFFSIAASDGATSTKPPKLVVSNYNPNDTSELLDGIFGILE
jgi:hypothetical protein